MNVALERTSARLAIEQAERAMLAASHDRAAFAMAKRTHEAALADLERLEWAEKAERERLEKAERDERLAKLHEAQDGARAAHVRVKEIAGELAPMLDEVAGKITELRAAEVAVRRGAHHESAETAAGLLNRQTVSPNVALDGPLALRALQLSRELVRLANIDWRVALTRVGQGGLR